MNLKYIVLFGLLLGASGCCGHRAAAVQARNVSEIGQFVAKRAQALGAPDLMAAAQAIVESGRAIGDNLDPVFGAPAKPNVPAAAWDAGFDAALAANLQQIALLDHETHVARATKAAGWGALEWALTLVGGSGVVGTIARFVMQNRAGISQLKDAVVDAVQYGNQMEDLAKRASPTEVQRLKSTAMKAQADNGTHPIIHAALQALQEPSDAATAAAV